MTIMTIESVLTILIAVVSMATIAYLIIDIRRGHVTMYDDYVTTIASMIIALFILVSVGIHLWL